MKQKQTLEAIIDNATPVKFSELLDAYEWVSGSGSFENSAYLDRETGKIYFDSDLVDVDDELPEDYEDVTKYIVVPRENDLDLGRNLAIQFADDFLSQKSDEVRSFFRKRGAYSRFKDLLDRCGMLERWYQYEAEEVEAALREWAEDNDIRVDPGIPKPEDSPTGPAFDRPSISNVNLQEMMKETDDAMLLGSFEGICAACDEHTHVNDIGLCDDCNAKMDRDLIRKRDWDYSASAFGCPLNQREALRNHIIDKYGAALELLAEEPAPKRDQNKGRR